MDSVEHELRMEIDRLGTEIDVIRADHGKEVHQLKAQLEQHVPVPTQVELEMRALRMKVAKYELWFQQNASLLATHRIGGYSFVEPQAG